MSGAGGAFIGGVAGGAAGAMLSRPGGGRRIFGIIGVVVSVIVGIVLAILMSVNTPTIPGTEGNRAGTSALFVVAGLLWLPLVGSKMAFPWSTFLLHWRFTVASFTHGLYGTIAAVVAVVLTAILAIVFPGWWLFAFVMAAIVWGATTAIVTRRVFDAQIEAEAGI